MSLSPNAARVFSLMHAVADSSRPDAVSLAQVRAYTRNFRGRTVKVREHERNFRDGSHGQTPSKITLESKKAPAGSSTLIVPAVPPSGKSVSTPNSAVIARALKDKIEKGDAPPEYRTKSHMAIVAALIRERSPLVRELLDKLREKDLSSPDRHREFTKIAIEYLRLLKSKGITEAGSSLLASDVSTDVVNLAANVRGFTRRSKTGKIGRVLPHTRQTKESSSSMPVRPSKSSSSVSSKYKAQTVPRKLGGGRTTGSASASADKRSGKSGAPKTSSLQRLASMWAAKLSKTPENVLNNIYNKYVQEIKDLDPKASLQERARLEIVVRLASIELRRRALAKRAKPKDSSN